MELRNLVIYAQIPGLKIDLGYAESKDRLIGLSTFHEYLFEPWAIKAVLLPKKSSQDERQSIQDLPQKQALSF